jgi:hypothetical protein
MSAERKAVAAKIVCSRAMNAAGTLIAEREIQDSLLDSADQDSHPPTRQVRQIAVGRNMDVVRVAETLGRDRSASAGLHNDTADDANIPVTLMLE